MSEKTDMLVHHLEEHPHTTLFARVADALLDAGDTARAWEICRQGIRRHPTYVTGWFISAKAAICIGHYAEARDFLCQALDLQPQCIAARRLLDALPGLELRSPPHRPNVLLDAELRQMDGVERTGPRRRRHGAGNLAPDIRELTLGVERTDAPAVAAPRMETTGDAAIPDNLVENDLELLASILENARIPIVEEDAETAQAMDAGYAAGTAHRPATETLAGIYARQGQIDKAIDVYETLCRAKPERRTEFERRIAELRVGSDTN